MPSTVNKPGTLRAQFETIEKALLKLAPLWKPQPFKQRRPPWCESHPELAEALLALDGDTYARLFHNDDALQSFLAQYVPDFSGLQALTQLPESSPQTQRAERHLDWEIPGRKWQQIDRFSRAIGTVHGALLEWCGGKGHLGRVLAMRNQVPVTTLEHNGELCAEGERLAMRAGVQQVFHQVDVLSPLSPALGGFHTVALHACGELHRTLLRRVIADGLEAVDIAPCCYHLGSGERYQAFNEYARLQLSRDDLRLAVTGNATSSPREVRLRDREMAWKLGFIELRNVLQNDDGYQNLRPVDKRWLKAGFEDFCHALASRECLELPKGIDWQHYETLGWQRQREVMRLSLPRHAVRRGLELWLVLDMALALRQHGYEVRLQNFCPPYISPRNILLSARRLRQGDDSGNRGVYP
jgi:hypothetical protein